MKVKTGELKNNLSRFLKQLAQTGESITVLDRNRAVARLIPLPKKRASTGSAWTEERQRLLSRALKKGVKLQLPKTEPPPMKALKVVPLTAPDGRTDVESVVRMRKEKHY